jgi:hypothetical protein
METITAGLLAGMRIESLVNRIQLFQKFRAFYDNDFDEIKEWIQTELKDNYTEDTLKKLRIRHQDGVQKVLRTKVQGIFDNEPSRELYLNTETDSGELETDKTLDDVLLQAKYNMKIKEALKQALFFNVVLVEPVERNGKIEIDIITGDTCEVETDALDFNKPIKVMLSRWDSDKKQIIILVWTETEHYILDAGGQRYDEWNGKKLGNPYGVLPFAVLRIREGIDFWGEPNWNLLQSQIEYDINLSNFGWIIDMQSFGVWVANNLDLKEGMKMNPSTVISVKQTDTSQPTGSIECVVPSIQFEALKSNLEFMWKTAMNSEGLSSATSSNETSLQSGVSKGYDEREIEGIREDLKNILYYFEIDLLNKIKVVWNKIKSVTPLKEGIFDITYSEEKSGETPTDKVARRDSELKYGIKTEIDFIMEDFEVDRDEAIEILKKNLALATAMQEPELIAYLNSKREVKSTFLTSIK